MIAVSLITLALVLVILIPFSIATWDKMDKQNLYEWYEIVVYRTKDYLTHINQNDTLVYNYEVEVKTNSNKKRIVKAILTQEEYNKLTAKYNIEHLERVNEVSYYVHYAHSICDKFYALNVTEFINSNFTDKVVL